MPQSSPKILVTGGAGFIGSHTVVALHEAGYTPIIVDNFVNSQAKVLEGIQSIIQAPVKCYEVDCCSVEKLRVIFEQEKVEGVIHFAAYKAVGESVAEPLKYYQNNLQSLLSILLVMKQFEVNNLVFSSSCTVYGEPTTLPVAEDAPVQVAASPYGNTKQICEEMIHDQAKAEVGLKALALRYFNPIGAHPSAKIGELPLGKPNNLIPFITQTAAGLRPELTVFGDDYPTPDGTCIRDYIHVQDLAEAHVKALHFLQKQQAQNLFDFVNIGTGKGHSVLELIQTFEQSTNTPLNYRIGARREGDVVAVYANPDKSRKLLDWEAKRGLAESLQDAWRWQQNQA